MCDRTNEVVVDVVGALDSNGDYNSAWIDATNIREVVASWETNGSPGGAFLFFSNDGGVNRCGSTQIPNGAPSVVKVTAKYFRLHHNSGSDNAPYRASVRVYS